MSFEAFRPYVPNSVGAIYDAYARGSLTGLAWYNKNTLINTALAVTGYFIAAKSVGRFGFSMEKVALVTVLALPGVAKMAVGGHFVVTGVLGAVAAGRDVKALAKFTALAAFGYFANTPKYVYLLQKHFYDKLPKKHDEVILSALTVLVTLLASRFDGSFGLSKEGVALFAAVAIPTPAAQKAISGCLVSEGVKGMYAAGKNRDIQSFAQFITKTALAFFPTTGTYVNLLDKYLYYKR